eukprot:TRINITY_DN19786_c0_g1_i1.p1 TRINITY_DN19786_c0_g1~~TRINITY_DN19786_c0_g1_i1.p1  ORF type:complete len:196 (-),score=35.49 TRINITY_DN19786_c0_g1_i1:129-716(-)
MIRRPPRSTQGVSSAASDVYKRQGLFTGVSAASGIIVGNLLGSDKKEEAYAYSKWFMKVGISGGIILGLFLMYFNKYYIKLYSVDKQVIKSTYIMIIVYSSVVWIKIANMIGGGGILRSGGETKITLYMDLLGTWVIGIPAGFVMAFVFKLELPIVYLGISIEELVRLIITGIVCLLYTSPSPRDLSTSRMPSSA